MPRWAIALIAGVVALLVDRLVLPYVSDGDAYQGLHIVFLIFYVIAFLAALILFLLWLFAPNGRARY